MAAEIEKLAQQLRTEKYYAGADFIQKHGDRLHQQHMIPASLSSYGNVSDQETFADKMIVYRQLKGLSQRGLAHKIGVDHSSLSRIEKGGRVPSIATIAKIMRGLELSPEQIFDALNSFEK